MKLADFLFARLKQLGVEAVHGVPGDYNLTLLDYVEPSGLQWIGNANELNAGYAADGYARLKGVGAIITTFGVGELSAINAIAGAFTERAAVVHIVGTPPRNSQENRLMIHHTLGDGDYRHFGQMVSHVTAAQTNLIDPRSAPQQINEVLRECLIQSRPVYIEVPVDMVDVEIQADLTPISVEESQSNVADSVLERISRATQPIILVDGETRSLGIIDQVQRFVDTTRWPTFTSQFAKGLIDMTSTNVYGIYKGSFDSQTRKYVEDSDLVICFGPHFSSTNTYNWSTVPRKEMTIAFKHGGISVGNETHRDASVKNTLEKVLQNLPSIKTSLPDLPRDHLLSFSDVSSTEMIKQNKLWRVLGQFLRPGDILMAETGTPAYGAREMPFPKHTRLYTAVTWLSIGYMLPACQGAALAQRELIAADKYHDIKRARTILLIGDGSFQMTVQELSTIIRLNLNVVIFLINNDGYTIERCIHGVDQKYNDISFWRYLKAPYFFGASENSYTGSAKTYGELQTLLEDPKLSDGEGLRMVEIFMDKNDAPAGPLLDMMTKQAMNGK